MVLTLNPTQITLAPGESREISATASHDGKSYGAPTIAKFGNEQIKAEPTSNGFTVTAAENAKPGTHAFTVTGTLRSGTGSAPFTVTVEAPDTEVVPVSVAFTPNSITLEPGGEVATVLTVRQGNLTLNSEVALDVPVGLKAKKTGNSVIVGAEANTIPGNYAITASTTVDGKRYQGLLNVAVNKPEKKSTAHD